MMHELLLAESTYRQMEVESKLFPNIRYVTINDAGEIIVEMVTTLKKPISLSTWLG